MTAHKRLREIHKMAGILLFFCFILFMMGIDIGSSATKWIAGSMAFLITSGTVAITVGFIISEAVYDKETQEAMRRVNHNGRLESH